MSTPSVKKNFLYSTFYHILSLITPFITAPYIARVLGVGGVGIQSYTSSIQAYFTMFAVLGTSAYGSREIARERDNAYKRSKVFWEIELLTCITTSICLAAWFVLIYFSKEYRLYYLIWTISLVESAFNITWFFRGLEQFRLIVVRNTIFKLLGIAAIFLFVRSENDLWINILLSALSNILSSIAMWPYLKKWLVRVSIKDINIKPHFKETLVYFIPTIATSIYNVLDKTLIGLITHDSAENGYYQQAEKIITMAQTIVSTSIASVLGVRISYLFKQKKYEEIHRKIDNSANFILFMGIGCMFGVAGVAKNFVPLFYGPGYDNVEYLLYIFCPVIVIIGISNMLGSQYYNPVGKRAESAKYLIVGSCINLCLNLLLIPKYNSYGAAVATVAAETVIAVLYIRHSCGYMSFAMLARSGVKKLIAGIMMC
ncbi:MAG: oligosaccharide flippase family protein, partial [Candidatus Ornithomonoglobus sp.]